jgi:hypothetical protein
VVGDPRLNGIAGPWPGALPAPRELEASGSPAPTIVAFAKEWDADLVIMGSHGRTGVARLLLGSVARNVLHHASCSVLVVRRHADPVRGRRVEAVAPSWTLVSAH